MNELPFLMINQQQPSKSQQDVECSVMNLKLTGSLVNAKLSKYFTKICD